MTVPVPSPWPRVRAVLADAGIHPREVRTGGVNVRGYWHRDGQWTEWPEGVGELVVAATAADRAAGQGWA